MDLSLFSDPREERPDASEAVVGGGGLPPFKQVLNESFDMLPLDVA